MNLISIKDALTAITQNVKPTRNLTLPLQECNGYFLADDIKSPIDLPSFNNSAMDGYVFRFEDYASGIRTFTQSLEVKAGDTIPGDIKPGCCFRIFTGAPVPENGTLVIMQEHIAVDSDRITIEEEGSAYFQNIRSKGEQILKNAVALEKGCEITPAAIGYCASLGMVDLPVFPAPSVSILTTGNELVKPGKSLQSGQLYESNSPALVAGFSTMGVPIKNVQDIPDDFDATFNCINTQIEENDFLVLTGGISVGEYDFVGKALNKMGVETIFYKVNQKPGKPFFFGKKGSCYIFALPGNPAAVMTCFNYYLKPAIRKFMGSHSFESLELRLPIKDTFTVKGKRDLILKSKIIDGEIEILDGQSSNMMHTFARANALTLIEAKPGTVQAGELVRVIPI